MNYGFLRVLIPGLIFAGGAFIMGGPVWSDEDSEPRPAPTAAVNANRDRIRLKSRASLPSGASSEEAVAAAYNTAELEGLYSLAVNAEDPKYKGSNEICWDIQSGGCQYLGWLARTASTHDAPSDSGVVVSSVNDSWLSYKSNPARASYRLIYKTDIDKDGKDERIYLCPDTGLEVRRDKRVIGALYPLGSFQAMSVDHSALPGVSLPSDNIISYTAVHSIKDASVDGDALTMNVVLEERNSIYGLVSSRRLTEHQYILQIAKDERSPFVNILEPVGSLAAGGKQTPFRGVIDAPAGILSSSLAVNDEQLWSSPLGLEASSLDVDLAVDLKPGENNVEINVADLEGRKLRKVVNIECVPDLAKARKNRALIVGINSAGVSDFEDRAARVRQAFLDRSFSVKTICGAEATRENIMAYLDVLAKTCAPGDVVTIYLAGDSIKDGNEVCFKTAGGTADGKISGRDIEDFYQRVSGVRLMLLTDCVSSAADSKDANVNMLLLPRQLKGLRSTSLLSGFCPPDERLPEGMTVTDTFLEALKKSDDVAIAAKKAYPAVCSNELKCARKAGRELNMPALLTF